MSCCCHRKQTRLEKAEGDSELVAAVDFHVIRAVAIARPVREEVAAGAEEHGRQRRLVVGH